MPFASRLIARCRALGNPIVAGIDPRAEMLPEPFRGGFPKDRAGRAAAFRQFGRELIDVLANRVPAVKFQAAFYEALGPEGMATLRESLAYARARG